eukprot:3435614-Amphidinium_carterae.1
MGVVSCLVTGLSVSTEYHACPIVISLQIFHSISEYSKCPNKVQLRQKSLHASFQFIGIN